MLSWIFRGGCEGPAVRAAVHPQVGGAAVRALLHFQGGVRCIHNLNEMVVYCHAVTYSFTFCWLVAKIT